MAVDVPHFALPFRFTSAGTAAVVEQGSDDDVAMCCEAILSYPIGSRDDVEDFGVPEQAFMQGGAKLDEIRDAIDRYEPRARPTLGFDDDDTLADFVQEVRADLTQPQEA